ncbi:MAG: Acyl-CoA thioesterase, partial [Pseudomonadota bacterium]
QHWFMTLFQHDGQIATTASAVFAIRRETWHSTELDFPVRQPALELARADTSKAPEWTHRYDMRTIKGLMIDGQQLSQEPDAITEFWIHISMRTPHYSVHRVQITYWELRTRLNLVWVTMINRLKFGVTSNNCWPPAIKWFTTKPKQIEDQQSARQIRPFELLKEPV